MTSSDMAADDVPSPCVNVCALDAAGDLCLGCFRNREEIATWSALAADGRRRVLAVAEERRAAASSSP